MATAVQGVLINHGSAPYKNDPNNQQSYFVEIKNNETQNNQVIWGMGFRDAIEKGNVKNGDNVIFSDLGIAEGTKKRNWSAERYEPLKTVGNSIEPDNERELDAKVNIGKEKSNNYDDDYYKDEVGIKLPDSVKNNYEAVIKNRFLKDQKVNFYDIADVNGGVAFEDREKSLFTSRSDEKTIAAMLDVAESKGWSSLKLKGTEEFKQKAWLEAKIRGYEVRGYEPSEQDLITLKHKQAERTNNQIDKDAHAPSVTTDIKADISAPATAVAATLNNEPDISAPATAVADINADQSIDDINTTLAASSQYFNDYQDYHSNYDALAAEIDKEAFVRSEEFNQQSSYDPNLTAESFHDNLAAPTVPGMSQEAVMAKVDLHPENSRYAISNFDHNEKRFGWDDQLVNGIHIKDTLTNEHYLIMNVAEVDYDPNQPIHAYDNLIHSVAEYYQNDQQMADQFPEKLEGQDKEILMKLGLNPNAKDAQVADFGQQFVSSDSFKEQSQAKKVYDSLNNIKGLIGSQEIPLKNDYHNKLRLALDDAQISEKGKAAVMTEFLDKNSTLNEIIKKNSGHSDLDKAEIALDECKQVFDTEDRQKLAALTQSFEKNINLKLTDDKAYNPSMEAQLSNDNRIAIEAWRRVVNERFKDHPDLRQQKHDALNAKIPDIVAGHIKLDPPMVKQEVSIEVRTQDRGSQDRSR